MISLHPDFYNMTFRLKSNRQGEGRPTGLLKPIAVHQDGSDLSIVCVCVGIGAVVDLSAHWLDVVPPDAD